MQILPKIFGRAALLGTLVFPLIVRAQINNPLAGKASTVTDLLINFTKWLLGLVAILALLAIVAGGIRMILAFGREDAVKSAKQIIFWAVAGFAVSILSFFILNVVQGILNGP